MQPRFIFVHLLFVDLARQVIDASKNTNLEIINRMILQGRMCDMYKVNTIGRGIRECGQMLDGKANRYSAESRMRLERQKLRNSQWYILRQKRWHLRGNDWQVLSFFSRIKNRRRRQSGFIMRWIDI